MDDIAVIVHGVESPQAAEALYSTVHGAGRVMSRRQAKKAVDFRRVQDRLRARGTALRRAGADEAPEVYRTLDASRAARAHDRRRAHAAPADRRHGALGRDP